MNILPARLDAHVSAGLITDCLMTRASGHFSHVFHYPVSRSPAVWAADRVISLPGWPTSWWNDIISNVDGFRRHERLRWHLISNHPPSPQTNAARDF